MKGSPAEDINCSLKSRASHTEPLLFASSTRCLDATCCFVLLLRRALSLRAATLGGFLNAKSFDPLDWILKVNAERGGIFADPALWWDQTTDSRELALLLHDGQTRTGSDLPYSAHLAETAAFCATAALSQPGDLDLVRAVALGWLHDSVEDQGARSNVLIPVTGIECHKDILALTKDESLPKALAMLDSVRRIKLAGVYAALGKLSDRSSNLLSDPPPSWSPERSEAYREEGRMLLNELGPLAPAICSTTLLSIINAYGRPARAFSF